jgi:proline iminopeptidase
VADPATNLEANTTEHLIGDIERLREHLRIDRWLVWGGSWGVTLGLAYAERYPERVTEMVLLSCTMTRPSDVHWLYHETGRFFPEQCQRYRAGGGNADDLVAAYNYLLNVQPDPDVRARAAQDWCDWEDAVNSLAEGWQPSERYKDPRYRMEFARLCAHYYSHAAWLEDGQLLRDAHRLAGIPGVLIHGRFDIGGPPDVPWLLHQAWPDSELHLVRTGHQGGDKMIELELAALNRFAQT